MTDIAGTTRDVRCEHIHIDGMPLRIIDTADPPARRQRDEVERIGISVAGNHAQADRCCLWWITLPTPSTPRKSGRTLSRRLRGKAADYRGAQ